MKCNAIFVTALALSACGQTKEPQGSSDVTNSPTIAAEEGTANSVSQETSKPSGNPDMSGFAREVDTNGDGKMSKVEWEAKGLPNTSFNGLEKGRGYVTQQDYENSPAPPGIDLNGDGKLTVEEFKQFDKQAAKKGPPPAADKQGD